MWEIGVNIKVKLSKKKEESRKIKMVNKYQSTSRIKVRQNRKGVKGTFE